jgi:catechol 2,3-dioxygenase-like lactoylglutathione lyase family enzyme
MTARLHHVQVTVPCEDEAAVIAFYGRLLGLEEIAQPPSQASQGGAWYRLGNAELHLKPDDISREETRRSRRHVCLAVSDIEALQSKLVAAGVEMLSDARPIPGVRRFFARDPGGNRIEITEG